MKTTNTESTTATITVHDDAEPSRYYPPEEQAANGATDYSVTIEVAPATKIEGGITLYRDEANGGLSPCGSPIDGWVSGSIVAWLHTLDERSYARAVESLSGGVGTEEIEIATEATS